MAHRPTQAPLPMELARPHVGAADLEEGYRAMAADEEREREAMADLLTAASKLRLREKAGELSAEDMAAVEGAIRTHLGL